MDDLSPKPQAVYSRKYYSKNKETLRRKQIEKYKSDPEYREQCLAASRDRYQQLKKSGLLPSKKRKSPAEKVETKARLIENLHTRTLAIVIDGQERNVQMHTVGFVANALGRSIQGLRLWESTGFLPKDLYRDHANRRLYTSFQVKLMFAAHKVLFPNGPVYGPHGYENLNSLRDAFHLIWDEMPAGIPVH